MRTASLLSCSFTSFGSFAGPSNPVHRLNSKPGTPTSLALGRSGSTGERSFVDTASAPILPPFTSVTAPVMGEKKNVTLPPITLVSASGVPLNGT